MCNIEKLIKEFYRKFTECNSNRGLKRYYEDKGKISNQRKIYHGKNKDKLLQKKMKEK